MINQRIWRELRLGIKTLWLHKMRSLLTMLGVVFGVASVIAMLAVGEGASREALERIRALGSNNIIIRAVHPTDEQTVGRVRMRIYGLDYADRQRIQDAFPDVRRVVPAKILRKEAMLGPRALELRVVGTTSDWFDVVRRELVAGRHLAPYDEQQRANVAVLTEHGARRLLASQGALGTHLRIGSEAFTVIGIIRSVDGDGGGVPMPDQDIDAYIPLEVARTRFGDVEIQRSAGSMQREMVELHQIIVEVDSDQAVISTAAGLERMMARNHPRGDYRISVPLALLREAEATRRTFNVVLGSIAGISLLVGGIGIMNIMLASVTERTREIGIRRAIGAKRRQIVRQFLIETVVLSVVGGLIGLGLGLAIPAAISVFAGMPTVVTPWSMALALGISAGIGIVFGFYPALRAARLDPIVALRHD